MNPAASFWGCTLMKDDDCASGSSECVNTTCQTFKQSAYEDGCFFWVCQLPTITWESFEGSALFMFFLFIPMNGNKILKEFRKRFARKAFYREYHAVALIERPWISHTYHHWDDNHHHTKYLQLTPWKADTKYFSSRFKLHYGTRCSKKENMFISWEALTQ